MSKDINKTQNPLRIIVAASEAVPFAKVGGLGDVAGILPRVLTEMGHEVKLVMPFYTSKVDLSGYEVRSLLAPMGVPMGGGTTVWCRVLAVTMPEGYEVWFVEQNDFFGRSGIYDENGQGYWDNGGRFVFFSRAVLQACQDTGFSPHVIHCHDWMTSAIPAYLKYFMTDDPTLGYTGSLLTIHNIGGGYQGVGPEGDFMFSGLPWEAFNSKMFESNGMCNLLKGGIANADLLNAVSPGFAREITEPEGGGGLDGFLRDRLHDLHGVLNGVDYDSWNPETDKLIPANYSHEDMRGKAECKRALQAQFGLEQNPHVPLFGVVSRMNYQKGLDLIPGALHAVLERNAQFIILGTGDAALEGTFMGLPQQYPGRAASYIGFSNELAHQIEAGSDVFLMPSRWEPCGLNQLYSLRYGTLPLVRATGGLDDTVENYDPNSGEGTGFKFWTLDTESLQGTMVWAAETFWDRHDHFHAMQVRAMQQRFTWERAAQQYQQLYEWAIAKRRHWR